MGLRYLHHDRPLRARLAFTWARCDFPQTRQSESISNSPLVERGPLSDWWHVTVGMLERAGIGNIHSFHVTLATTDTSKPKPKKEGAIGITFFRFNSYAASITYVPTWIETHINLL